MSYEYSPVVLEAAHQTLADLVDGGSGPGKVKVKSAFGDDLAVFELDMPCGTVDPVTGRLTFAVAAQELDAPAAGQATYAVLEDGDEQMLLTVEVVKGTGPVPGKMVLSVIDIVAGGSVELVSFTVG